MANPNLTMGIKGADKTGAAFNSVKMRAKATSASIRAMMGSAIAAAGAYMGFSKVVSTIQELGQLSDTAMRTGTTTDELTRMSTALNVIGIQGVSINSLARSFDYMKRTTGRSGMAGFYETIEEIGKIPDAAERSKKAMQTFGRSGMQFIPLINAAKDGSDALKGVAMALPAIPQSAADAGDKVGDAMNIMSEGAKSIWAQGIAKICDLFDNSFAGGVREAAAMAAAYMEYYVKKMTAGCIAAFKTITTSLRGVGETIGSFVGSMAGTLWAGGSFGEAWDMATTQSGKAWGSMVEDISAIDDQFREREERFAAALEKRKEYINDLQSNYDKLANGMSGAKGANGEDAKAAVRDTPIRNDLITSINTGNRMAMLGPQTQSELKKQTKSLEKIEKSADEIADEMKAQATEDASNAQVEVLDF